MKKDTMDMIFKAKIKQDESLIEPEYNSVFYCGSPSRGNHRSNVMEGNMGKNNFGAGIKSRPQF